MPLTPNPLTPPLPSLGFCVRTWTNSSNALRGVAPLYERECCEAIHPFAWKQASLLARGQLRASESICVIARVTMTCQGSLSVSHLQARAQGSVTAPQCGAIGTSRVLGAFHTVPLPAGDLSNYVESTPPSPRYGHGFAFAIYKLFVFGGGGDISNGERARSVERKAALLLCLVWVVPSDLSLSHTHTRAQRSVVPVLPRMVLPSV